MARWVGQAARKHRERMLQVNGVCCWCFVPLDEKTVTLEHIVPRSLGGKTTWKNLTIACRWCNQALGNRTWMTREQIVAASARLRARPPKVKRQPKGFGAKVWGVASPRASDAHKEFRDAIAAIEREKGA